MNSWNDDKPNPLINLNWSDDKAKIFDTPKPFGEVMKEFNESVKTLQSIDQAIESTKIIIGMDQGSSGGDKTIVSIIQDGKYNFIGENVTLTIPYVWNDKTLRCIQIGDLAIINFDEPEDHLLIHVPTLTWFDNAVPERDWEHEDLMKWVWKVQQDKLAEWAFIRHHNNDNYKNIPKVCLEDLKLYCLSVSI